MRSDERGAVAPLRRVDDVDRRIIEALQQNGRESFRGIAARVGVSRNRSIVVEDAAAGIEAARRAGMKCIGVNPRFALPADVVVKSLTDLPRDAFDRLIGQG